jgi:biotin synthase
MPITWRLRKITHDVISEIYHKRVLDLVFEAAAVHREHNNANEIQVSSLISIKTRACPEGCSYCSHFARFKTDTTIEKLMPLQQVLAKAAVAKQGGASRLCMGAAWRNVKDDNDFDQVLEMVSQVNDMGLEACTLGMVTPEKAQELADEGLYAYNHNLDTSREELFFLEAL